MTMVQMQGATEEQERARLEEFTSGLEAKMQRYRLVFVMSISTLLHPVIWEGETDNHQRNPIANTKTISDDLVGCQLIPTTPQRYLFFGSTRYYTIFCNLMR